MKSGQMLSPRQRVETLLLSLVSIVAELYVMDLI
jgi:hypothetical protein